MGGFRGGNVNSSCSGKRGRFSVSEKGLNDAARKGPGTKSGRRWLGSDFFTGVAGEEGHAGCVLGVGSGPPLLEAGLLNRSAARSAALFDAGQSRVRGSINYCGGDEPTPALRPGRGGGDRGGKRGGRTSAAASAPSSRMPSAVTEPGASAFRGSFSSRWV